MGTVYLIRHGQSEANRLRIWGGNFPLSQQGREQALTVPSRISPAPDKVVSSTLLRANETARIAYPDRDVEVNRAFDEISFGNMEMAPMRNDENWQRYCTDPEGLIRSMEGDDLEARTGRALDEIRRYAQENEVTAIFTSDTLIRSIVSTIRGGSLNDICGDYIVNCGIVVLDVEGGITIADASDIKPKPTTNLRWNESK